MSKSKARTKSGPAPKAGGKTKPASVIWIVAGVIVAVIVGWNLFRPAGGVVNVDAAGAQKAIDDGAQILDVRSAGEYQLGHIPGAILVEPQSLESQAASWDKDAMYLVYCATGARSASAVQVMTSLGFTNIRHFAAGLQAWPGELQKGEATSSQNVETSGKPVMIEFYTNS